MAEYAGIGCEHTPARSATNEDQQACTGYHAQSHSFDWYETATHDIYQGKGSTHVTTFTADHQQQFFALFLDHKIFMQDPFYNGRNVFIVDFAHENIHAIFLQSLTVSLGSFGFCGHIK